MGVSVYEALVCFRCFFTKKML